MNLLSTSYSPIPNETSEIKDDANLHVSPPQRTFGFNRLVIWSLATLCVLLAISNVIQYKHIHYQPFDFSYTGFGPLISKPFLWRTDYNSDNATLSDTLWKALHPAHGVVAIPKAWVASKQLPASMDLPNDSSKSVYILEAYHHLHCLTMIRTILKDFHAGVELSIPFEHSMHCLDALRQEVMCNAKDTPFYTWADGTQGNEQERQCRNWEELSAWAGENTACYEDLDGVPIMDRFGQC